MTPNSLNSRPVAPRIVGQGQKDMLHGDILVLELLGLILRLDQEAVEPAGQVELVRRTAGPAAPWEAL